MEVDMTVTLSPKLQELLDNLAGETPDKKIAHLLLRDIRRNMELCEQERLGLEIKYGMEYGEFQRQLETGALGDAFSYDLEQDAMR